MKKLLLAVVVAVALSFCAPLYADNAVPCTTSFDGWPSASCQISVTNASPTFQVVDPNPMGLAPPSMIVAIPNSTLQFTAKFTINGVSTTVTPVSTAGSVPGYNFYLLADLSYFGSGPVNFTVTFNTAFPQGTYFGTPGMTVTDPPNIVVTGAEPGTIVQLALGLLGVGVLLWRGSNLGFRAG